MHNTATSNKKKHSILKKYFTVLISLICLNVFSQNSFSDYIELPHTKAELLDVSKINKEIKEMDIQSIVVKAAACAYFAVHEEIPETKEKYRQSAILFWSESIKRKHDVSSNYNNRGLAYYNIGEFKKALYDFNEVTKLKTDDAVIHYHKARCKAELKDFYGAISDYSMAITKTDNNKTKTTLLINRSNSYVQLKNYDKAVKDLDDALNLDEINIQALIKRGLLYLVVFDKKEKGCIDISKAGENGYDQAYEIIKDYCN